MYLQKSVKSAPATILKALTDLRISLFLLVYVIGIIYSSIIPPFQSPDEFVHISRAYLFTKGKLILDSPENYNSGGLIDNGLLEYIKIYAPLAKNPLKTLPRAEIEASKTIGWAHTYSFADAAGAAYYFPAIYTPQTIGLLIGERLDMTIDESYRLARFLAFTFSLLIVLYAFKLFPPNWFVVSLLILPMSIFQIVSASIDGLTTSLSILCVSIFIRGTDTRYSYPDWMAYLLGIVILIISTCRIHLFPLTALPLFIYFVRRRKIDLWSSVLAATFSVIWIIIAVKTTSDTRIDRAFTTSYVIGHYVKHPFDFFKVLVATAQEDRLTEFYKNSFIGILGWLDASFEMFFYRLSVIGLGVTALLSLSFNDIKKDKLVRTALIVIATISILLIFFALLVTWTPHPASVVNGVQGRYFIVPAILLGYSLNGYQNVLMKNKSVISILWIILYGFLVCYLMPQVLINRYYAVGDTYRTSTYTIKDK